MRDFMQRGRFHRVDYDDDDFDPMSGVANMADAMLVLAVALMVAIISFWQIDMPDIELLTQREMTEVEDVEAVSEEIASNGSSFNDLGRVYEDPETGKMYVISEE